MKIVCKCQKSIDIPEGVQGTYICPICQNNIPLTGQGNGEISPSALTVDMLVGQKHKTLSLGTLFGNYRILEELGRGGMGIVYKAVDLKLHRKVALKLILGNHSTSKKDVARFMREAQATALLDHPNVVKVYEVGTKPKNYFSMEYIEGYTLKSMIKKENTDPKHVAMLFQKVARGLHEVHKKGILHRDLKPANIMINQKNEPKIMDFGLAKVNQINDNLSRTGDIMGTPAYMSPEQAQGRTLDKRSDVYALGASLYEILTGRPPFQGATYVNIVNQITDIDPIPPKNLNPDIPTDLNIICLKTLQKEPKKRYVNAAFFANDLQNFLENRPINAKPAGKFTYLKKWLMRNKAVALISINALFIMILGSSWFVWQLKVAKDKAIVAMRLALKQEKKAIDQTQKAKKAQQRTEKERQKAEKAKEKAISFGKRAEKSKEEALQERKNVQRQLYYSQILLTDQYRREDNIEAMDALLTSCPKDLRHWEWGWLTARSHQELLSISQQGVPSFIDFNNDGSKLVAAYRHKTIVWDILNKRIFWTKKNDYHTRCSVFSPNGKMIATGNDVGLISLFNASNGQLLKTLQDPPNRRLIYCAFSPDGKKIAAVGHNLITVWNIVSGKRENVLQGHIFRVRCCAFSPDSKMLVSAGGDSYLALWDLRTGKQRGKFLGHSLGIQSCVFSHDGTKLISAGKDKQVIIWNVKTGKVLRKLIGHTNEILSCDISPDDKIIASAGLDRKIILWDAISGKKIKSLRGHSREITLCKFYPEGKYLATCSQDATIKLWKTNEDTSILRGHIGKVICCSFSPDGTKIVSGGQDGYTIIWDLTTGKKLARREHRDKILCCSYSPDGSVIATGSIDKKVILWEAETGKKIKFFKHGGNVNSLSFHPKGTLLAVAARENLVFWDIVASKQIKIHYTKTVIYHCTFSPNGKLLATCDEAGWIKIWDMQSGNCIQSLRGHLDRVRCCNFSPDGSKIVSAHENGNLALWDVATGKQLTIFKGHSNFITYCDFSPDGKRMISASGDHHLILWNIEQSEKLGRQLLTLKEHKRSVNWCTFSSDGKKIASAADDNTVKIWRAVNWK